MKREQHKGIQSDDKLTVANLVQFLLWLPDEERAHIADLLHTIRGRDWREIWCEPIIIGTLN